MALDSLRLPRSFAGDKAAPIEDFFASMAHALSRGDPTKKQTIMHFCTRVQVNLCARAVFDIGGLQRLSRNNMLQLLVSIEKDTEHWVDSIEDVLEFHFPTPVTTHLQVGRDPAQPPPSAALVPQSVGGPRVSTYAKKDAIGLGAQLLSDGTLDRVVFTLAMFPKLVTSTPSVETIKEKEVTHILDTVFEMTFTKFGCVHVDLIYRMHCGQKLRLLFPNLPTRGGKLGANRKFDEMLKWRFGNQRKSAVDGKIPYKAGMVLDRINLCDAAIELVEEMNFPVTMVNEGKLETKFSDYLSHASGLPASVAANSTADAAAMPVAVAVPYFGSAPFGSAFGSATLPLPPRQPTQGLFAPVTASAANAAAAAGSLPPAPLPPGASVTTANKRESDTMPSATAKKAKAAPAPARTEPVRHSCLPLIASVIASTCAADH